MFSDFLRTVIDGQSAIALLSSPRKKLLGCDFVVLVPISQNAMWVFGTPTVRLHCERSQVFHTFTEADMALRQRAAAVEGDMNRHLGEASRQSSGTGGDFDDITRGLVT